MKLILIILSCRVAGMSQEDEYYSEVKDLKRDNDYFTPEEMADCIRTYDIIITNGFDADTDNGAMMIATLKELISYLRSIGNKIFLTDNETKGFRAVATRYPEGPPFLNIKYDDKSMMDKFKWSFEDLQYMKSQLKLVKFFWKKAFKNAFMRKCKLWPEINIR